MVLRDELDKFLLNYCTKIKLDKKNFKLKKRKDKQNIEQKKDKEKKANK